MRVNIPLFLSELRGAGIDPPPMRVGGDGALDFTDSSTPQAVRDQVAAVLAAHDPTQPAPDTSVQDALNSVLGQTLLALMAQQQGTDVATLQTAALTAHTAALAAKSAAPVKTQ